MTLTSFPSGIQSPLVGVWARNSLACSLPGTSGIQSSGLVSSSWKRKQCVSSMAKKASEPSPTCLRTQHCLASSWAGDPYVIMVSSEELERQIITEKENITIPEELLLLSLQSCLTLCDPIDGSPSGSSVPEILQARILEWVAISLSSAWKWKVKVKSVSCAWLLVTPWTADYQASPSMGFSSQEYWSGVPLPSPSSKASLPQKQSSCS